MIGRRSFWGRLRRVERGSVSLEFAVVVPLLAMLAFGAVEMGSAWSDSQAVLSSTRSAARSLAQFGDDPVADRDALLAVEAAFADPDITVQAVIIYESDQTVNDGGAPDPCVAAALAGTQYFGTENCNVYDAASYTQAITLPAAARFGCNPSHLDRNWCPTTRTRTQATATFIGVEVHATRTSVTGADFVPVPTSIAHFSVMRLEPLPT